MEPVKLHLDYDSVMVLLAFFTNKYDLTVSMATPADLVAKNKPVSSGIHRVSFPLHKENAQETKSFVPSTSSNIRTSTTTNATSHASSSTTSTSSSSTSSPASTPESSPQTRPRGDSTSTFSETDGSEGEAERSTQGIVGVEDEMVVGADVFIQRFEVHCAPYSFFSSFIFLPHICNQLFTHAYLYLSTSLATPFCSSNLYPLAFLADHIC